MKTMQRISVALLFLTLPLFAFAQPDPTWTYRYNIPGSFDTWSQVSMDENGSLLLVGRATGTDRIMAKISGDYRPLWIHNYSSLLVPLEMIPVGNGEFLHGGIDDEIGFSRYDRYGNTIWEVLSFTPDGEYDNFENPGIVVDDTHASYMAGEYRDHGFPNVHYIFAQKRDADGNFEWETLWEATESGSGLRTDGIGILQDGRIAVFYQPADSDESRVSLLRPSDGVIEDDFLIGTFSAFEGVGLVTETNRLMYATCPSASQISLIQMDASGNELWSQTYDWTQYLRLHDMIQTSDGGYLIAGYQTTGGSSAGLVLKVDANGTEQWRYLNPSNNAIYTACLEKSPGVFVVVGGEDHNSQWNERSLFTVFGEPQPSPDLRIALRRTSPYEIPAGGGVVGFNAALTNPFNSNRQVTVHTEVFLPDESYLTLPSYSLNLPPGEQIYSVSQGVPGIVPAGNYAFIAKLEYDNEIVSEYSIIAHKLDGTVATSYQHSPWPDAKGWDTLSTDASAGDVSDATATPQAFALGAAYPNPFNASTVLDLTLPKTEQVRIVVTDVLGRQVWVVRDEIMAAGPHRISFHAGDLASGLYFVTAATPSGRHTVQKVILLR
ncbi:T9SS type A sorting domain-containing protein [bacterium]|nr:T9SS type A sorting domain-containing protein [bacterium]